MRAHLGGSRKEKGFWKGQAALARGARQVVRRSRRYDTNMSPLYII